VDSSAATDSDDDDDVTNRIWTRRDLRLLHELQKPVSVVVAGIFEDPHRFGPDHSHSTLVATRADITTDDLCMADGAVLEGCKIFSESFSRTLPAKSSLACLGHKLSLLRSGKPFLSRARR